MTDPVEDAARSAAAILAADLGLGLPAEVEAALAARDIQQRPDRYLDPVSLASLIVAIATLAWTIYNDRRKQTPAPPPDAIARQVRITLRDQDTVLPPAPTGSPKWSPPRSPATPNRPSNHAPRRQAPLLRQHRSRRIARRGLSYRHRRALRGWGVPVLTRCSRRASHRPQLWTCRRLTLKRSQ